MHFSYMVNFFFKVLRKNNFIQQSRFNSINISNLSRVKLVQAKNDVGSTCMFEAYSRFYFDLFKN